jgi:hypothetical protein
MSNYIGVEKGQTRVQGFQVGTKYILPKFYNYN